MTVSHVVTYVPAWTTGRDRVAGPDEDAVTMTVAVGRGALDAGFRIRAVVVVTHQPALVVGSSGAVILRALGLPDTCSVDEVIGGADAVLRAVLDRSPGTLVVGVDVDAPAGAGAIGLGEGIDVRPAGQVQRSLPIEVRSLGQAGVQVYEDPRLLREQGWRPAVEAVSAPGLRLGIAGVPAKAAVGLGGDRALAAEVPTAGASAVAFALAAMVDSGTAARLVAIDAASATAADVDTPGPCRVVRLQRPALPIPATVDGGPATLAISLPAYERAFDSRIGLVAARCACGALSLPARVLCLDCGAMDATEPAPLPRRASVYTATTVHVPVPGKRSPYTLAICELGDTGVRLLAPLADAPPAGVRIGDEGTMVLRRLSDRQGVPDYGYAFVPDGGVHAEVAR